jgi:hypothetical protein
VKSTIIRNPDSVRGTDKTGHVGSRNLTGGMTDNGFELNASSAEKIDQYDLYCRAKWL